MWSTSWPSIQMVNLRRELDRAEGLVRNPPRDQDDEVTRALTRFLTVRMCGYLEAVVDECVKSFIESKASPRVVSFATSSLNRGRNPSPSALLETVRKFDSNWADDLECFLNEQDELLKRELSFLVNKRNRIAHGQPDSVTSSKALDLLVQVKRLSQWFIERFDPR